MIAKCKDTTITDPQELINFAEMGEITYYNGYNEDTEFAVMKSSLNPEISITIIFENKKECKLFESKIKKQCKKFIPKKYRPYGKSTVIMSNELKEILTTLKHGNESYEMVIWKLLLKTEVEL